jgi:hypothetical protein
MPPGESPGRLEHRRRRHPELTHVVHQFVVERLYGHVDLEDDQRLVVTRIGDDRPTGRVARYVIDHVRRRGNGIGVVDAGHDCAVGTLVDEKLVPVTRVIQLRVIVGTPPVYRIEVVAGRPEVGGGVGVGLLLIERRGVESDVVVDELADEGEPRRQERIGVLVVGVVVIFGGDGGARC